MTHWKRQHTGRYISRETGWIIERSEDGGWNAVNPETGGVFDKAATKKELQRFIN